MTSLFCSLPFLYPAWTAGAEPSSLPCDGDGYVTSDTTTTVTPDSIRYIYPPQVIRGSRWNEIEARSDHLITVIGPQRLSSRATFDIGEVVGQSSGVVLKKTGGPGSPESMSIRGSTTQQVLVLLNGRRLNTAQGGGIDISQFTPGEISRIEIYREGNGARWSSASMGGILNIITDGKRENGLRVRTLGASYGTRSISVGAAKSGRMNLSLDGSFRESDNDFDFPDPRRGGLRRRANAGSRSTSFTGMLETRAQSARRLNVLISGSKDERGAPGPIEFPTPEAGLDDSRIYIQPEFTDSAGRFDLSVTGGLHRLERRYRNPDPVLWADDLHRNTSTSIGFEAGRNLGGMTALMAGTSFETDHLTSTTDGSEDRDTRAAFLSASIGLLREPDGEIPRLSVTPGVRLEKITGFEARVLPSLATRVNLVRDRLIMRGSVGKKYRPPSFDELFWPLSSGAEGNPDLRPERSTSAEISATAYLLKKRARIRGSYYRRRLTDLIEWTPGAGGIWRPHNIRTAREEGVEIEGAFRGQLTRYLPPVSLEMQYSLIDATDRGDDPLTQGKQLVRRPGSVSSLVLETYPTDRLSLGFSWTEVGTRYLTQTNSKWVKGHDVIDLNMKYALWKEVSLFFSIKNVVGKSYYDVDEFPVPGRTVMLALDFYVKSD